MKIIFLSVIIFSFFIILFSQSIFAQSPTAIEKSGRFVIMDSYSREPGPHPYHAYFYPDDQTGPYKLDTDTIQAYAIKYVGKRVMLSAPFQDSSLAATQNPNSQGASPPKMLEVKSMKLLDLPAQTSPPLQVPLTVRSMTLLSKFSDVAATPVELFGPQMGLAHDNAFFVDRFYTGTDSLKQFYLTSSYNDFTWNGAVDGWRTLSSTQATYVDNPFPFDVLITDTIALHDPFVNFCSPTAVSNLVLVFNGAIDPSGSAFGSLGLWNPSVPTADGCNISVTVTWQPDDGFFCCGLALDNALGVTGHEVGHNNGFEHTPPPPGAWTSGGINDPYHDPWSIMSTNFDLAGPSALVMGQRDQRGWVDVGNQVTIPDGTSSIVTLDYINEPEGGTNPQMAKITLPSGYYIVEAHHDEVFNDTPLDGEGAVMYRFFPTGNNYAYLTFGGGIDKSAQYSLVATSGTTSESDFLTANLDVIETFTDLTNNVVVETLSKTATTVTVLINNNNLCAPPPSGDWVITSSCTMTGPNTFVVNNGDVRIENNSELTVPNNVQLKIPFQTHNLTIQSGSGMLIQAGGQVTSGC